MTEIGNIRCKSAKEVPSIANKILGIKGKLKALGTEIDDAFVISSIIRSLPDSLKNFLSFWHTLDADMKTSDRFIDKLNETAKAIANKEKVGELETAMLALCEIVRIKLR